MEFPNKHEQKSILHAASHSINSLHNFLNNFSNQPSHQNTNLTTTTLSNFKNLSNLLNRTGRARFRRAPLPQPPQTSVPSTSTPPQNQTNQTLTLDFTKPNILKSNTKSLDLEFSKETFSVSSNSSFLSSAITGDGSVNNGKQGSSLFLTAAVSGGNRRCQDHSDNVSGSNKCHCNKKRKNRIKKTVRVKATSSKMADIPQDEYSWRKYGQKPIKGSPYPRGYYRCSTVKECPARKKVERATDDPTMLIVTYEEEHRHEMYPAMLQDNNSGTIGLVLDSTLGLN